MKIPAKAIAVFAAFLLMAGQASAFFVTPLGGKGCAADFVTDRWISTDDDETRYEFRADGTVSCEGSCYWSTTKSDGKKEEFGKVVAWELEKNDTVIRLYYSGGTNTAFSCSTIAKGKLLQIEHFGTFRRVQ